MRLRRALGPNETSFADPFLLLDDFHSDDPADYIAGFPWHPHRGIETVTYMIRGVVEHGDSIGNRGTIDSGDVQWMTAGSGILHQEMPRPYVGMMQGFQLWVNLPASHKMMSPRYRDIKRGQIPSISEPKGVDVKIIAGEIDGTKGPVRDLVVDIEYLDVTLEADREFERSVDERYSVIAYVFEGSGLFSRRGQALVSSEHAVVFGDGKDVQVKAKDGGVRFLLVSGEPLHEPIAWGGPIVMNTQSELNQAFDDLQDGTFIKSQ